MHEQPLAMTGIMFHLVLPEATVVLEEEVVVFLELVVLDMIVACMLMEQEGWGPSREVCVLLSLPPLC
jgi:hypothetical protein